MNKNEQNFCALQWIFMMNNFKKFPGTCEKKSY